MGSEMRKKCLSARATLGGVRTPLICTTFTLYHARWLQEVYRLERDQSPRDEACVHIYGWAHSGFTKVWRTAGLTAGLFGLISVVLRGHVALR